VQPLWHHPNLFKIEYCLSDIIWTYSIIHPVSLTSTAPIQNSDVWHRQFSLFLHYCITGCPNHTVTRFWRQVMRHSEQFHGMTPASVLCPTVSSQIVPCLWLELLRQRSVMRHRERLCIGRCSVKMSVSSGRCRGCCIESFHFESRSAYQLAVWLCYCRPSLDTTQHLLPDFLIGRPTSRALSPQWHKATQAKVATVCRDLRIEKEICHRWSAQ
jgi:hypothetical protein